MNNIKKIFNNLKLDLANSKLKGKITISLAGIDVVITGKDAVGNMLEEWFFKWATLNGHKLEKTNKSQKFPDYFVPEDSGNKSLLDIKSFNIKENPAFDMADAYAFLEMLLNDISKIDANYIIFGYSLDDKGNLIIENIWCKKIWEAVGKSKKNHITCQIRTPKGKDHSEGRLQKIRPYHFHKSRSKKKKFNTLLEFLETLQKLLDYNKGTKSIYSDWLTKIKKLLPP